MRSVQIGFLTGLLVVGLSGWLHAGETDPAPEAKYGDAANNLPLKLYKDLKRKLDAAQGIQTPGTAKLTKGDAQKALVEAAKANAAALTKALRASQAIHRQLAARALRFAKDKKTVLGPLHKALDAEPDVEVRQSVVAAVAAMKDAASVEPLVVALGDKDKVVRTVAVQGLGAIKDSRALDPLLEVLSNDDDAMIRMRAASALARIGDPKSVDALLKAMDSEKDQRVRMAIAGAVRKIRGRDTPATAGVPNAKAHDNVLNQLAKEMKGVEEKLRDDRHDQAVQVDQKGIEDKLTKLIEMLKKMQQKQGQGKQQQKKRKKQGQKQKRQKSGSKPGSPSSPLQDSNLGGSAQRGALRPGEVSGIQDRWAKLPPHLREEMLQVYREEMPERWKKRLEAYYLSVAAEQNKD